MPLRPTALALLFLAAAPASGQALKPGLWEVNHKMDGAADPRMQEMARMHKQQMAEMRKQLDSMPPAQRKQMEAMVTKMGAGGQFLDKDGMTMKICVTPEMAAQQTLLEQRQGSCSNTRSPVVGGVMKISFACTTPPSSGEGTVTFSGDSGYRMQMTMHTTQGGKPMSTSMTSSGRFVAASCGDVKPPPMPAIGK
jgi:hypothetical protein